MARNRKIGDRIDGRFEVRKIFKGGLGIVYVVFDHEYGVPFVAKTFQDEVLARSPIAAARFDQEVLAWIDLDRHQNVTRAHFARKIEGTPFLFLEYVSGGDLRKWIGTPRLTADLSQALRFAIHFCDGMSHALAKGIKAHHDIKPGNCLITEDGTLKVTDFGLAKIFQDGAAESVADNRPARQGQPVRQRQTTPRGLLSWLFSERPRSPPALVSAFNLKGRVASRSVTQSGMAAGTAPYMTPEQFDDFKRVDVRGDIRSFGVMLFEMANGQCPLVGRTFEELKRMHKTERPRRLSSQAKVLNEIIQVCLAKDPARRYADFGVICQQLAEVYQRIAGKPAPRPATESELDAWELTRKGSSLGELGRAEEALICYERALEIDPRDANAWLGKGSSLRAVGRIADALAAMTNAQNLGLLGAGRLIAEIQAMLSRRGLPFTAE
ncbi:MAG: serine/threonine protein kinase [Thermoguttaceae bacterium]